MISLLINRKDGTMKFITLLLILAAIAYGVKYAYDNGMLESVNNTVERTGDFAKRLSLQITPEAAKAINFSKRNCVQKASFYARKHSAFTAECFL